MKPYGKQPFSFKSDPEYQEQQKYKMERLHEKIMMEEQNTQKDKYGNMTKKQIPMNKPISKDLVESKKKRFERKNEKGIHSDQQERGNEYNSKRQICKEKTKANSIQKLSKNEQLKHSEKKAPSKFQKHEQKGKQQKSSEFLYHLYGGVNGPDAHLIEMLQRQIIVPNDGVKMSDIADLQKAKSLLNEAVLLPIFLPNYFQGIRKPWKGILLFGPPGTGKTMLARAISQTGKVKFFSISACAFASKWRGQAEKLVRLLFQMARFYAPSIIFIDEIDSIASKRSEYDSQSSRRVKTQILVQMDGAGVMNNEKQVIVIAATNRPWDLDEALKRRLQKRIYIPLPNEVGRKQLFIKNTKQVKLDPNIDFDYLVDKTKGFSGADIVVLIRTACYLPLRRYLKKLGPSGLEDINKAMKEADIPITNEDFKEALKDCSASVGKQDILSYQEWMNQFGST